MKKSYIVLGIIIILLLVGAAVMFSNHERSQNNTNQTDVQTVSQNGVVLKFPSDWVIARAETNDTVVAIADSKSIDSSSKYGRVNVNVEKRDLNGESLNTFVNQTYSSILSNSSNQLVSLGNSTAVNGKEAYEAEYLSDIGNNTKEHRAVWVESNNQVYVILCTAPQGQFESVNKYFNYIISNIEIS